MTLETNSGRMTARLARPSASMPFLDRMSDLGRWMRRNPLATAAAIIIVLMMLSSILAPLISPYDPTTRDANAALDNPSAAHWFGTDDIGRDTFSRVLWGGRITIWIAGVCVACSMIVGVALGLISGYYGKWRRTIINRVIDILFAFPELILAMGIAAAVGPGPFGTIFAVGLGGVPAFARITYSAVLGVRDAEFVAAARLAGTSHVKIVVAHILPNSLSPILVQATLSYGFAILTVASLSFVGLGTQPPTPEWGLMVSEGRNYILSGQWWLVVFPGAAIAILVLSFNVLGDTLRDILDPRHR